MFHFFEAITNKKGDALTGYFVKVIDPASNGVVDIFADVSATPIVSVSGVANAAEVDTDGNASFYVAGGTYHLDIYATDSTTFVRRISNLPMIDLGASVANVATRTAMAAITGITSGTSRFLTENGREGQFVWDSSNLSAKVTADPSQGIYVPPASAPTGASGAWVRKFSGPFDVRWFGAVADDATDCRAAVAAAVSLINTIYGGGKLYASGDYFTSGSIALCQNLTVMGDNKRGTTFRSTHAGTGTLKAGVQSGSIFYIESTINSSTPVNVRIQDIQLKNTHASNIGAGFYDQGGTFVTLQNVNIEGFKYGVVFDQTELADIDTCTFNTQLTGSIWLVNGTDLNASASQQFTNRISVKRCQINNGTGAYGVIDDGGTAHSFVDNNYNGCLNHIRVAGVTGFKISGGEFESAAGPCIKFDSTTLAGAGAGSCIAAYIGDGATIIPTAGQNCIICFSLSNIVFNSVYFGNTAVVKFNGTTNANSIYAINCGNGGGGATFDGRATNHWEVGHDGTTFAVRTNLPINSAASTAASAGLNVPHGTAPSSPVNGDVWTTTSGLFVRVNGATFGPLAAAPHRGARVNKSVTQSGANYTTATIISYDAEDHDTDSIHNFASTVTITIATPGVVTWTGHNFLAGSPIVLTTSGALPTGFTAGTTYYVVSPAANTFQLAATPGGAAINTSGTQSGTHTATNYSRLVVPAGVSWVEVGATLRLSGFGTVSDIISYILKNGLATYVGIPLQTITSGPTFAPNLNLSSGPLSVTAGDYFENILQSSADTTIDVANTGSFWMNILA